MDVMIQDVVYTNWLTKRSNGKEVFNENYHHVWDFLINFCITFLLQLDGRHDARRGSHQLADEEKEWKGGVQ
ncbi:hypothetical protein GDO81_017656 [Engystomops pustulosus]|uniref:Uncharacterized protein n=1 Tax=Engystomops pustulosus TaxID=76066 RepID=A0AAV7A1Q0_ENGPU|nr:hypothetical protein GDO81_017656 [Engystomops pustulosus]